MSDAALLLLLLADPLTDPRTGLQRARQERNPPPTHPPRTPPSVVVPPPSSRTHTPLTPQQTLAEQLSFLHLPRPFKSAAYTRNANRRTKNLKTVLGQERERERTDRERRRLEREEREMAMDVDGASLTVEEEDVPTYTSIEAPPSLLPPRHYCDITGLEAPYTDPRTGLRYHDRSVYDLIKNLSPGVAKDYLSARGVNPIVK